MDGGNERNVPSILNLGIFSELPADGGLCGLERNVDVVNCHHTGELFDNRSVYHIIFVIELTVDKLAVARITNLYNWTVDDLLSVTPLTPLITCLKLISL